MKIGKDKVVTIDYTLKDDSGNIVDTSQGSEPLAYIHGMGNIVPGLESALDGGAAGDKVSVSVPPEKGYGVRDESLIQVLTKDQFAGVDELEVGMQFHAHSEGGVHTIVITQIESNKVTVDGNHPLAGMVLHFDIDVRSVRDATKEEMEHGHVHGPGGHHH